MCYECQFKSDHHKAYWVIPDFSQCSTTGAFLFIILVETFDTDLLPLLQTPNIPIFKWVMGMSPIFIHRAGFY